MSPVTATEIWLAQEPTFALRCADCEDVCGTAYGIGHWESHGALGSEPVDDDVLCASCVRQRFIRWALTTPDEDLGGHPFERLWVMEA